MESQEKIELIKKWLGTGSINIFGMPMSGKDTQGIRLAEAIGGKFLSSGMIIRAMEKETGNDTSGDGKLTPTNLFFEWVLPYFERRDLWDFPLVLSSIGRWNGEEDIVMSVAEGSGHRIKAVISLEVSEQEILNRWQEAKNLNDRGERIDDSSIEILKTRVLEFKDKTLPVLSHYNELGLLIKINAEASRDEVFGRMIDALYNFAQNTTAN